jgi:ribonuclease T1
MQNKPLKNRAYFVSGSIVGAALVVFIYVSINAVNNAHLITPPVQACSENNIPRAAYMALLYYDLYKQAPPSFNGIKKFYGDRSPLPKQDQAGNPIAYIESDIYPVIPKINRGAQRIVVGENGTAYYTPNHYQSFVEITPDCVSWFSQNARNL